MTSRYQLKSTEIDLADLARHQDLFHLLMRRRVAIVEGHDDPAVVALFRVENRLALGLVGGQRLFRHHVEAAIEALDDVFVVEAVDGGDHQEIGLGLLDHLVEVGEGRRVGADVALRVGGAFRVWIAQPDKLDQIGIPMDAISLPHMPEPRSPVPTMA